MKTIGAFAAALIGTLAFAPAFAQDANMSCSDFNDLTDEQQTSTVETLLMEVEGAEASAEMMPEIVSMLSEKCNEFSDSMAIDPLRELPLAVQ